MLRSSVAKKPIANVRRLTYQPPNPNLVGAFPIRLALALDRAVCDHVYGDAGLVVEGAPEEVGGVEEEGLEDEEDRDPLVVADAAVSAVILRHARLLKRKVVRTRRPTHLTVIQRILKDLPKFCHKSMLRT